MKIEHIAIWVQDIEGMKSFYENYFGARSGQLYHNTTKKFTSYFLSFEDGPRIELMHRPDIVGGKSNRSMEYLGLAHLAMSVGSIELVNSLTEQLRSDGYEIIGEPRMTGDGYYESVVLDPEQNRIEITR